MTPLQIIISVWCLGATICFAILIHQAEKDEEAKKAIENDPMFSSRFLWIGIYVIGFIDCLLRWPWTLLVELRKWIIQRMAIWTVKKILKKAAKGKNVDAMIVMIKKRRK